MNALVGDVVEQAVLCNTGGENVHNVADATLCDAAVVAGAAILAHHTITLAWAVVAINVAVLQPQDLRAVWR